MAGEVFSAFVRFFAKDEVSDTAQHVESSARGAARGMDEAADAGGSRLTSALKGVGSAASVAVKGLAGIAGAAVAGVAAIGSFVESQQQEVENMGKLTASYEAVGMSAEDAMASYGNFMGLVGDSDQATEAAQDMANLAEAGGDIDTWYNIASGAVARFGDALPTENLIEASSESAHTGVVTGGLADAYNWAEASADGLAGALGNGTDAQAAFTAAIDEGLSVEDAMNAALATSNDTTERQAMIQNTLNYMYGETGKKYQEANAALIDYRKGQAEMNSSLATMAQTMMPVQTLLMGFASGLINDVAPGLSSVVEGLQAIVGGDVVGGFETLREGATSAMGSLVQSIVDAVPMVLQATVAIAQALLQGIIDALPQLVEGIAAMLPMIIEAVIGLAQSLVMTIAEILPTLLPTLIEAIIGGLTLLIATIAEMLPTLIPLLLEAVLNSILAISNALLEALPVLITAVTTLITQIAAVLPTFLPQIMQAAVALFTGMVQALPQIAVALVGALPQVITAVVAALPSFIGSIIQAAIALFLGMVQALPQIIPQLVAALPQIITSVVTALPTFIGEIISAGIELFLGLVQAIPQIVGELLGAVGDLMGNIFDAISNFDLFEAAGNLLQGLVDGIIGGAQKVLDSIGQVCEDIWNGITGFFGIHSPSRKFRWVGEMDMAGLEKGIDSSATLPVDAVVSMGESMQAALDSTSPLDYSGVVGSIDASSSALATKAAPSKPAQVSQTWSITTGETDAAKLARMIARENRRQSQAIAF